ncbi:hypothetical protein [Dactylosporangium sp. NPDC051484]|uniref:hypothetical protein n=1 Tax=Dactylosporangium sp. NPDC051484 TaxID=3154942 RepID=UPI00344C4384
MLQRVGGAFGASVGSALMVLSVAVVTFGSPAEAKAPSPSPSASGATNPNLGPAVSGTTVCTITDPQVTEVSGLVATADGYAVINDSNPDRSRQKIFFLDDQCRLIRSVGYPSSAFDPEDLALAKDGTLWVADVGDNTTLTGGSGNRRSSIALWSLAPGANTPVIHRLAYPDGRARDAEALLIDGAGRPIIITKDPIGEVYTLTQPLPANNANPVPLTRAGSFKPQSTGTSNPYGIVGTAVVTGAAMSPDGKRAVVRTMSDAYEFDVTDGDVVAAITTGTPRITPLPNEPQGEAIAFTRDGAYYLTASDQPKTSSILRYTPYQPPATSTAAPAVQTQAPAAHRSFRDSLSLRDITRIVTGIGLIGVLMIVIGVVAVIRSRRRRRALLAASEPEPIDDAAPPPPPATPLPAMAVAAAMASASAADTSSPDEAAPQTVTGGPSAEKAGSTPPAKGSKKARTSPPTPPSAAAGSGSSSSNGAATQPGRGGPSAKKAGSTASVKGSKKARASSPKPPASATPSGSSSSEDETAPTES